jgi:diphosphomevalonate decarboxylase
MKGESIAIAHPNVALSKYWGKRPVASFGGAPPPPVAGNVPAVPSLSVTLGGLTTRTRVRWRAGLSSHRVVLGGRELGPAEATKAVALLDRVREAAGSKEFAEVESASDFPVASGLASSASGFAALALAAVRSAGLPWDAARVSDLARRGSASAARSVFGGFVELEDGVARQVAPCDHLPLAVLVCVTTEAPKAVPSSEGMRITMERSPYARAWLEEAPRLHELLREALLARDFDGVGRLAEASALAMHASAIAAGVVYFSGASLAALGAVRAVREAGTPAYATMDAGPHVKVLVRPPDAARVRETMQAVPGVLRIIEAWPGDGAHIEEEDTSGAEARHLDGAAL